MITKFKNGFSISSVKASAISMVIRFQSLNGEFRSSNLAAVRNLVRKCIKKRYVYLSGKHLFCQNVANLTK